MSGCPAPLQRALRSCRSVYRHVDLATITCCEDPTCVSRSAAAGETITDLQVLTAVAQASKPASDAKKPLLPDRMRQLRALPIRRAAFRYVMQPVACQHVLSLCFSSCEHGHAAEHCRGDLLALLGYDCAALSLGLRVPGA